MVNQPSHPHLSRREFLRRLSAIGGAAALASFLEACSPARTEPGAVPSPTAPQDLMPTNTIQPSPTIASLPEKAVPTAAAPTPTPARVEPVQDGRARLAFVKTTNRAEGVRRAIELLGINPVSGKSVFLKPNFNSADPAPGSTHPDILVTLIAALKEMGAREITLGDRSGMGDTHRVMEQMGVLELAQQMGFQAIILENLPAEAWEMITPEGSHWENGFPFARPCLEAEAVVQACCLKTHRYGGHFTLSLKNSVGLVGKRIPQSDHDFMLELHNSDHQRRMIAEINTAYAPALIVMDGVEAFISGGPDTGKRVKSGVVLAGTDRIAMDAVGLALLRYHGCKTEAGQGKIFDQEQIARAVELGLGVDGPQKIEFVTGDEASAAYCQEIEAVLLAG